MTTFYTLTPDSPSHATMFSYNSDHLSVSCLMIFNTLPVVMTHFSQLSPLLPYFVSQTSNHLLLQLFFVSPLTVHTAQCIYLAITFPFLPMHFLLLYKQLYEDVFPGSSPPQGR